jgi:sugar/nucleoside kinase (ribokinase family)
VTPARNAVRKSAPRNGVFAAGSFILDHVKVIDAWPDQDMLANISSETRSNGGGPFNVLMDLRALGAEYPLEAAGLLGDDPDAAWIRSVCQSHGIDDGQFGTTGDAATSYTDAMCVEGDGRRTFFHQRGANSLFSPEYVDLSASNAKIFLLGYLLLLDSMDRFDGEGRTDASRLLEEARTMGFLTAVETVSALDDRFGEVVLASLRHTDFFFLNEVEASLVLGVGVGPTSGPMAEAAAAVAALGTPGRVVIHSAAGAVCHELDGSQVLQGSIDLPSEMIRGSTGAGDAFTAGYLFGVHEGADSQTCLLQGVSAAGRSLLHATASGGMVTMDACLALSKRFGFREF